MTLAVTLEDFGFLVASLGSLVDEDDVGDEEHKVASEVLDRLLVAGDVAKNTALDRRFPPTSFNTIAELEVTLHAAERFARWEASWDQARDEEATKRRAAHSAMTHRLRAALDTVLAARRIEIVVLPDRGE